MYGLLVANLCQDSQSELLSHLIFIERVGLSLSLLCFDFCHVHLMHIFFVHSNTFQINPYNFTKDLRTTISSRAIRNKLSLVWYMEI